MTDYIFEYRCDLHGAKALYLSDEPLQNEYVSNHRVTVEEFDVDTERLYQAVGIDRKRTEDALNTAITAMRDYMEKNEDAHDFSDAIDACVDAIDHFGW